MKPSKKWIKKKYINYSVDLCILVLFAVLAVSGMVLQVVYHIGDHGTDFIVVSLDQNGWLFIHKTLSILSCFGIGLHIQLHFINFRAEVCKGLLIKRSFFKQASYYFFLAYSICGILGLVSWAFNNSIVGNHPNLQHTLVEIHDKISFVLILLFALHLKNGMGWLLNQTHDVVAAFANK